MRERVLAQIVSRSSFSGSPHSLSLTQSLSLSHSLTHSLILQTALCVLAVVVITMATEENSPISPNEDASTAVHVSQLMCLAKTSGEALKMTDEECLASVRLGDSELFDASSLQQDYTNFMFLSSNYAAGKPASQDASGLVSWAAAGPVDGGAYTWPTCNQACYDSQKNNPPYIKSGSLCTNAAAAVSSVTTSNPWWEVDLQVTAEVKMVRVTGRLASRRSDLLKITVTSTNGDSSVCKENVVAPGGWPVDVECKPAISGNKVKLELSGVRQLELAEVEVFAGRGYGKGYGKGNLAKGKPTSQSSTDHRGSSSHAVDGNKAQNWGGLSCTHTAKSNSWWKVDLQSENAIEKVIVWNRSDCCSNRLNEATVLVDDKECGKLTGSTSAQTVQCNGKTGKTVKIAMLARSDWLTLCEVEVYQRQVCYDGVRYATEACAECTGPGPNQCTRCNDDAALVPFRAANHASATYRSAGFEGSCSKYTRDIQALDLPGAATTAASLLPSISTKWVEVSTSALFPAKSSTGMDAVDVHVNCLMYKVVWCAARTSTTQAQSCKVFKAGRIKSVRSLNFAVESLNKQSDCQLCANAGGHAWNGCSSCGKQEADNSITYKAPPVANLLDLIEVASEHEACRSAVQLL